MTHSIHARLCEEIVGDYRGPRPCVCDVIHQAQAADRQLVRDAMTEYMRQMAVAEKPSFDDYVNLGAMQALTELMDAMLKASEND